MSSSLSNILNRWQRLDFHKGEIRKILLLLVLFATSSVFFFLHYFLHEITYTSQDNYQIKNYSSATLVTNFGRITFSFDYRAPHAVSNFIFLSTSGFYDNTHINRVVKNFLIQGGDPLSKNLSLKSRWGKGDPGFVYDAEFHSDDQMLPGTVAMVNNGKNKNGSQFFILTLPSPWLVGQNTVLGHVTEGMEVVKVISDLPTGITGIPNTDVLVEKIELK